MEGRDEQLTRHKKRKLFWLRGRDLDDDVGLLVKLFGRLGNGCSCLAVSEIGEVAEIARRFFDDHPDSLLNENLDARRRNGHPAFILGTLSGNAKNNLHCFFRLYQPAFKGFGTKFKLDVPNIRSVPHRHFNG